MVFNDDIDICTFKVVFFDDIGMMRYSLTTLEEVVFFDLIGISINHHMGNRPI